MKSDTPFYVIMPVHREHDYFDAAIKSIDDQTYSNIILLICIETDFAGWVWKRCMKWPTMLLTTLVMTDNKLSIGHGRNIGLQHVNENEPGIVSYLDSDNQWEPTYAEEMVKLFKSTKCQAAYCGQRLLTGEVDNMKFSGYRMMDKFNKPSLFQHNYIDINGFCHTSKVSKDCRFDEVMKRLVDWDFILQIAKKTNFKNLAKPLSKYYFWSDPERVSNKEDFNLHYELVRRKHGNG